ncbi:MAG: helix-turn-helix domain-containing protein [Sphingomonas sp.]
MIDIDHALDHRSTEQMSASPEPGYINGIRQAIADIALDTRGWTESWAAPVVVASAPQGFGEESWDIVQDATCIAWLIKGEQVVSEVPRFVGRTTVAGDRRINLQLRGMPARYRAPGPTHFCQFYINDALLARVADGLGTAAELRNDLIMTTDPALWSLLDAYAVRATSRTRPASRVEMEARALLVVERLLTQHHAIRPSAPMRGGLAPWQLRRACDAMDAAIDGSIGLDDLADIVGCSPTHFSRAFKQSTGLAPFHWLAERRIDRAKDLLEQGRLSLAEVALAVGFAAQPQFTTAFGRATGMTPAKWRRERRG